MGLFIQDEMYPGTIIAAFGGNGYSQPPTYRVELDKCWGEYKIDNSNLNSPPRYPHLRGQHIIVGSVYENELNFGEEKKLL